MANYEEWRAAKRFTMKALKSLGFGRSTFEPQMHYEIDYFLKGIEDESKKGPVTVAKFAGPAASNIISLITLGERYNYGSPQRLMFDSIFIRPLETHKGRPVYFGAVSFMKWARWLAHFNIYNMKFLKNFQLTAKGYVEKRVKEVKKQYDVNEQPTNYIEYFIREVHENKNNPDFEMKYFKDSDMVENAYAFFVAGSATTQEYIEWWFLMMANYPQVQEKMRAEVDAVVGDEKVTLSMRTKMPYTEAVIAEVHRFGSLIGLNLPHIAGTDAEFGPYFLPAGTHVIVNMAEIHFDPDYFDKANEFIPERFLSEDGKKFIRSDKILPFGIGKRSCAGESLAQAEIFLFTVSTLQKFILKPTKKWNGETFTSIFARLPIESVQVIPELRKVKN